MTWRVIGELGELAVLIACLFLALAAYARREKSRWAGHFDRLQLSILFVLVLLVTASTVAEDVLHAESGPIDREILLFVHRHVPAGLGWFFEAVTLTGSADVLVPATILATAALAWAKRRREAVLLGGSVACGALIVYCVKSLVGRERPALWETEWYWGSSFPSGHTLAVSAFATAAVLVAARLRRSTRWYAPWIAIAWICSVGLSRLVLGVHWPTDVLVAACIGATLPLAISLALELRAPAEAV